LTDQSFKPFAPGDIFVPAPRLDPAARYPTGAGAVRQYDRDFVRKADVETRRTGLISGLGIGPDGALRVLDPQARGLDLFAADGNRLPEPLRPDAGFGSILFEAGGTCLMGEHLCGGPGPFEGQGRVMRFAADGALLATFDTETNGGIGGFLGVTHMALSADGRTLYHVSETGPSVYAHDLVENRRLGAIYTRTDPPALVFGLAMLPDGRLAVALGSMLRLLGQDGTVIGDVELPVGRGWANVVVRPGGEALFVLDFFAGRVVELALPGFRLLRLVDLGNPQGMTSLVEVP
jgi:hypothetical protein